MSNSERERGLEGALVPPDAQVTPERKPNHFHAPLLRAALAADVPAWLYGEAGSGKTTIAGHAADELDLPFRSISLGPSTSKSDLMGYRDATGQYHSTGYRDVYEGGGVFVFDEIDNAHPSIITILNSSIANGHGEFPDSRVERHQAARFVATANTIGRGANAQYVGRSPIDAATLDRFAFIPMDTDPELEESLALGVPLNRPPLDISAGDIPSDREWLAIVRAHRDAVEELGIRAIISQRATLYGIRLAKQEVGKDWLGEMLLYKGMKEYDKEKVQHAAERLLRRHADTLPGEKAQVSQKSRKKPPRQPNSSQENSQPESQPSASKSADHSPKEQDKDMPESRIESPPQPQRNELREEAFDAKQPWFTKPGDHIITNDEADILNATLVRSRDKMRNGSMDRRHTEAILSFAWQYESMSSYEIFYDDIISQLTRFAGKKHVGWSFRRLIKERTEGYGFDSSPKWKTEEDNRTGYIELFFPNLSPTDIVQFAQEFEELNGFIPGRITLQNWLNQHPDVGGAGADQ